MNMDEEVKSAGSDRCASLEDNEYNDVECCEDDL